MTLKISRKKLLILSIFAVGTVLFYNFALAQSSGGGEEIPQLKLHGGIIGWAEKIILFLPMSILVLVLGLLLGLARLFFTIAIWAVTWTLNNPFDVSFTNPATNPVINIGWTLLRDFTNMLFILGLAYIGLATALSLAGFNTKKIFGKLILVALIINFTPVICGVVVDICNIVANFFFSGTNFDSLLKVVDEHFHLLLEVLKEPRDFITLGKIATIIVYSTLGGFILFMFSALFFVRAPIIWLLVIFSPLAFFASIFPKTNSWFTRWWRNFLNWSMVAIPAGFFIYLSRAILMEIDSYQAHGTPVFAEIIVQLAPYMVALTMLGVGFFASLNISAMGAAKITGFVRSNLMRGGKLAARKLKNAGLDSVNAIRNRRPPLPGENGWQDYKQKHPGRAKLLETTNNWVKPFVFGGTSEALEKKWAEWEQQGAKGKVKKMVTKGLKVATRTAAGVPTLGATYWAHHATRHLGVMAEEKQHGDIEKEKKKFANMSLARKKHYYQVFSSQPANVLPKKKIAHLLDVVEKGQLKDVIPNEKERSRYIRQILKQAIRISPEHAKRLKYADIGASIKLAESGELSPVALFKAGLTITDKDKEKGINNLLDKFAATIKPKDIENLDLDTMKRIIENEHFHLNATGSHISKAVDKFGKDVVEAFNKAIEKMAGTENIADPKEAARIQREWYQNHNFLLYSYLKSTPAKALGVGFGNARITGTTPTSSPTGAKTETGGKEKTETTTETNVEKEKQKETPPEKKSTKTRPQKKSELDKFSEFGEPIDEDEKFSEFGED